MTIAESLIDRGLLPDELVRKGIRRQLRARLRREAARDPKNALRRRVAYADWLRTEPIVVNAKQANEQHYEVPAAFFKHVLGPRTKYSCGLWPDDAGDGSLAASEDAMLALTVDRAQLHDGMDVLDLGCGWGALTLWIAEHFPACRIVAVSNSAVQREYILARCRANGFDNVDVQVANAAAFDPATRFDRVISVEMLEHIRNYAPMFERIAGWLRPDGKLFTHVFAHRQYPYPFEAGPDGSWMGRMFFTGGQMPCEHLFQEFQEHLVIKEHWVVKGTHYARTSRAWLDRLDANQDELIDVLPVAADGASASQQLRRWRVFFMACEELWGFADGEEWIVAHDLWQPRG